MSDIKCSACKGAKALSFEQGQRCIPCPICSGSGIDWRKSYDAAHAELAALREELAQKVVLAVRDVCELEPADSDNPECLCIKASDLGAILSRHFEGVE